MKRLQKDGVFSRVDPVSGSVQVSLEVCNLHIINHSFTYTYKNDLVIIVHICVYMYLIMCYRIILIYYQLHWSATNEGPSIVHSRLYVDSLDYYIYMYF